MGALVLLVAASRQALRHRGSGPGRHRASPPWRACMRVAFYNLGLSVLVHFARRAARTGGAAPARPRKAPLLRCARRLRGARKGKSSGRIVSREHSFFYRRMFHVNIRFRPCSQPEAPSSAVHLPKPPCKRRIALEGLRYFKSFINVGFVF